jgi:hypothetical protein
MVCNPLPTVEELYEGLAEDEDLNIPDLSGVTMPVFPDLDPSIFMDQPSIKMEDLTTGQTGGSGVFDQLMTSVTAHLDRERQAGRVTNNDFAKTYVDFSTGALGAAIQFLLQKDQAHWAAIAARTSAQLAMVSLVQAQVGLEEAKFRMQMMAYQAMGAKAQTALVKMQLALARTEFCTAEYRLAEMLPKETEILVAQKAQIAAQTTNITQTTNTLLPQQVRGATAQADTAVYQLTYLLPLQNDQLTEGVKLAKEQTETQRAQTLDTRSDGVTPVAGTLGKQKDVQSQQIQSYKQDAQLKAARPFIDAWITMKTIDEGTLPPTNFNNANLDAILGIIRDDNELR